MTHANRLHVCRGVAVMAAAAALWIPLSPRVEAQGGVSVTAPSQNEVLAAGPDFATDMLGDPWDMSNIEDVAVDPMQKKGWSSFGFSGGRVGGTLGLADGAANGSHIMFLERAYWSSINPGRTGAKFQIPTTVYTKLAVKMAASPASGQSPRVYWFQNDLGSPSGDGVGLRYFNPTDPVASGNNIYVMDLTQSLLAGSPWTAAPARGFALYPNSSRADYDVWFDWVRITTGDSHPAAAKKTLTWSGGSGTSLIEVQDAAGTWMTVASGISGTSYDWNYGVLPPGVYNLRITRGGTPSALRTFRINTPPTLRVTDPDETGGEDFATAVLGNAWDMSDGGDLGNIPSDHLISRVFSGGQFHGTSDGQSVAISEDGIPVGDPMVYPLNNNGVVNTSRYRYLTARFQVDGDYDLLRGSVARLFWGSTPNLPYNVTVSKEFLVWSGMNTYTIDLASLTTAPTGGIVTSEGNARPWTTENIRYLRLDPHEFAQNRDFHIDSIKLAAMDETTAGSFTIRFTGSDADGDSANVALYYDTDRNPGNGETLITGSVALTAGQYVWNTSGVAPGVYYIRAVATDGRNGVSTYSSAPVQVTTYTPPSQPLMNLDAPAQGATVAQPFTVRGWAIDQASGSGPGVDQVHIYGYPNPGSGQPPQFLGFASVGQSRGDVGAAFGAQFTNSGFSLTVNGLAAGSWQIAAYAHSTISGNYDLRTANITVPGPYMALDQPTSGTVVQPFIISGWSFDSAASTGTGVDTLHVWAYPNPGSGTPAQFIGVAQYGNPRPDVGSIYGSRFTNSGYSLQVRGLAPGRYQFVVFSHSTATGTFNMTRAATVTVQNAPMMAVDAPAAGSSSASFTVRGWAVDVAAASGTGVDAVHVWGYRNGAAQFLGSANYGTSRPDVGGYLQSSQFNNSGYSLNVGPLASGTWDLVVYARSTVSGAFDQWRSVRIAIP